MKTDQIIIDTEFRALIPPLSPEEQQLLEQNIKSEGCISPLTLWKGKNILLDGNHRYAICQKLGVQFKTVTIALPDREAAADWIDKNQLGRRNLNPEQFSFLLGRLYNRQKKQGERTDQTCGQVDHKSESAKTAKRLGQQYGVSEKTVRRDGKFADAVERLKAVDPEIEKKANAGKAPAKRAVVKAAELLDHDPKAAEAVLTGGVTVAQLDREGKESNARGDNIGKAAEALAVNQTPAPVPNVNDPDHAEHTVIRAIEAGKAVLALDDKLTTVRGDVRASFYATFCSVGSLWKRLFPKTPVAVAASTGSTENEAKRR